jgi:hypothetical protein
LRERETAAAAAAARNNKSGLCGLRECMLPCFERSNPALLSFSLLFPHSPGSIEKEEEENFLSREAHPARTARPQRSFLYEISDSTRTRTKDNRRTSRFCVAYITKRGLSGSHLHLSPSLFRFIDARHEPQQNTAKRNRRRTFEIIFLSLQMRPLPQTRKFGASLFSFAIFIDVLLRRPFTIAMLDSTSSLIWSRVRLQPPVSVVCLFLGSSLVF